MKLLTKLKDLYFILYKLFFSKYYFGFIQGEKYRNKYVPSINSCESNVVSKFEIQFSKLIGEGNSVAFAAGRMAFYSFLKAISLAKGDEVILLGSTCSVMASAVIRCGGIPVYSDIDIDTFGSEVSSIKNKLTKKTRVIVAQHSFGIPCYIKPIVDLAKKEGIFLLEDCALTLGSKIDGKNVGTFGDAALFSFDHSKPINLLIGGLIYSESSDLIIEIQKIQSKALDFSDKKKYALYRQLLFENNYCNPITFIKYLFLKKFKHIDYSIDDIEGINKEQIPYPALFPSFLAQYGLYLLEDWKKTELVRHNNFKILLNFFKKSIFFHCLPKSYFNESYYIVPLRFVFSHTDGKGIRKKLNKILHIEWTWFLSPIISTLKPLDFFYYYAGNSPNSEKFGKGMVNLPCNVSTEETKILISEIIKLDILKLNGIET